MNKSLANNKLIAKNAVFLYVRMFVMMAVSLYTSRVVLDVLGVSDYGIYNIVGGIVVFFHFFNSTISGTLQRFFNIEMGKEDAGGLQKSYNTGLGIQALICSVVILVAETVGLYFINHWLNIESNRMFAANVVYQMSILTFCCSLLRTPQQALLIASEKMSFYAYVSIVEAFAKLGSVGLLVWIGYDKLIFYSIFQSIIAAIVFGIFVIQVKRQFSFKMTFNLDRDYLKSILYFSGWNVLGASFALTVNQLMGIFLNLFYGVTLNAAAGLATQVSSVVNQFSSNLSMAFSPQIVKLYSAKEFENFRKLMFRSSKTSFVLYTMIGLPLICLADSMMNLWLVEVPKYAVIFTQLCIVDLAVESFTFPLYASIQASGKVKGFNLGISTIYLLNIPIMYFTLWMGWSPCFIFLSKILADVISLLFRICFMGRCVGIKTADFIKKVICPCTFVIALLLPIAFFVLYSKSYLAQWGVVMLVLVPLQALLSLMFCFSKAERLTITNMIKQKIRFR